MLHVSLVTMAWLVLKPWQKQQLSGFMEGAAGVLSKRYTQRTRGACSAWGRGRG